MINLIENFETNNYILLSQRKSIMKNLINVLQYYVIQ